MAKYLLTSNRLSWTSERDPTTAKASHSAYPLKIKNSDVLIEL
jgi:hypothetical protein